MRKIICLASSTKIIEKSTTQPGRYTIRELSSKNNTLYENFVLDETFENNGIDGQPHKVCFKNYLYFKLVI